jgi:hypothetical protein
MAIYYAFPCEACFFSEGYTAANERIFITLSKEPLVQLLAWAESGSLRACTRRKWYSYTNCSIRTRHTVERATCWAACCIRRKLVRGSPLRASVCPLLHQLFLHFSVFRGLRYKGEQNRSPDATTIGVKCAWVRKSTLRTPLRVQAALLLGLGRLLSEYRRVLCMCSCPF